MATQSATSTLFESIFNEADAAGRKAATEMDTTGWADGSGAVSVKLGKPRKSEFAKWYMERENLNRAAVQMDGVRVGVPSFDKFGGIVRREAYAEAFAKVVEAYGYSAFPYTYLT